ncbi:MAG: M20/M25/M40 family metallo-hydrolase [Deferribacteres bacterium]|nr:M20/M25/M40 family metallo-hydrolase [Deferribacteres bacterium]
MVEYVLNQLVRLVSIPSVSGQEGELLFYLEEELANLAVDFERQRVEGSWYNILVGKTQEPSLIIAAHVDTVAPVDGIPPKPLVEDGFIKGLGVVDDKCGVATMLGLCRAFGKELADKGVLLAFLVDEEKSGLGSETLADSVKAGGAIVIEPTSFALCVKEAGSVEFFVDVRGKAAHGSCVEEGENAIHRALEVIKGFDSLSFIGKEDRETGTSCYTVFKIAGGDDELRIPDRCTFKVDFRLVPDEDVEAVIKEVGDYLRGKDAGFGVLDVSPGFVVPEDAPVVSLLKSAFEEASGRKPVVSGMKSWTDAQNFVARGIPAVVFGPGELSVCHTPYERIRISDVELFVKTMEKLITLL